MQVLGLQEKSVPRKKYFMLQQLDNPIAEVLIVK